MDLFERHDGDFLFSTDRARMSLELIHAFLRDQSYWVPGITRDRVEKAMAHSLCFGVFDGAQQIAFARVVSDFVGFAYLADVFVVDSQRGLGLGKRLIEFVLAHPHLQGLRRFVLATRDAHELYAKYGFTLLAAPERYMERFDPDALAR
jgi:GNAT superfamily N-acetyltransferase